MKKQMSKTEKVIQVVCCGYILAMFAFAFLGTLYSVYFEGDISALGTSYRSQMHMEGLRE